MTFLVVFYVTQICFTSAFRANVLLQMIFRGTGSWLFLWAEAESI